MERFAMLVFFFVVLPAWAYVVPYLIVVLAGG